MNRLNVQNIKLIDKKKLVSKSNDHDHIGFAAGIPPFLRGPYSTMYVKNLGQFDNMLVFLQQKIQTLFIKKI